MTNPDKSFYADPINAKARAQKAKDLFGEIANGGQQARKAKGDLATAAMWRGVQVDQQAEANRIGIDPMEGRPNHD